MCYYLSQKHYLDTSAMAILFSFVYQSVIMRREYQFQLNNRSEGAVIALETLQGQPHMNLTSAVLVTVVSEVKTITVTGRGGS
jgi:hypothetical protein